MPLKRMALLLAVLLLLGACAQMQTQGDEAALPEPRGGFVTDMAAFEQFIATRPSPEDFRKVYPDVLLVLPGDIATREFRMNNSRYFASLDETGRIIGGQFQ